MRVTAVEGGAGEGSSLRALRGGEERASGACALVVRAGRGGFVCKEATGGGLGMLFSSLSGMPGSVT